MKVIMIIEPTNHTFLLLLFVDKNTCSSEIVNAHLGLCGMVEVIGIIEDIISQCELDMFKRYTMADSRLL